MNRPNFNEWALVDLVAYCQAGDNSNGEWDDVTESERDYLVDVAIQTFNEYNYEHRTNIETLDTKPSR